MPQAATIESLAHAFRMMKAMQAQGIEWGEDYRRPPLPSQATSRTGSKAISAERWADRLVAACR